MSNLIIIGTGGHAKVLADIAILKKHSVKFWADQPVASYLGFEVSEREKKLPDASKLIIAIGKNEIRKMISKDYSSSCFLNLIHPSSIIASNLNIGTGNAIMAGVCINPFVTIGDHCIINTGSVVDHDCQIGSYVHISPNATLCGNVKIGDGSWIGAGSTIIQGVVIGSNVTIGAGSVVIKDVESGSVVVGNPGRIIRKDI